MRERKKSRFSSNKVRFNLDKEEIDKKSSLKVSVGENKQSPR